MWAVMNFNKCELVLRMQWESVENSWIQMLIHSLIYNFQERGKTCEQVCFTSFPLLEKILLNNSNRLGVEASDNPKMCVHFFFHFCHVYNAIKNIALGI